MAEVAGDGDDGRVVKEGGSGNGNGNAVIALNEESVEKMFGRWLAHVERESDKNREQNNLLTIMMCGTVFVAMTTWKLLDRWSK